VTTDESKISGKELETQILRLLYQRHQIHPDDNQAFFIHNQEDQYRQVMGLMTAIKTFVWVIGVFTLIAGIVGISNIMLIIVKDRTREIGIRKAMGATPGSIVWMILMESIFITGIAGYAGLILGVSAVEGVNYLLILAGADIEFFSRPEVNFSVALSATIVLVAAGAIAGFFPARRAAAIKPVEAMRNE
jgi:putative ABC transport system permease protein